MCYIVHPYIIHLLHSYHVQPEVKAMGYVLPRSSFALSIYDPSGGLQNGGVFPKLVSVIAWLLFETSFLIMCVE
jgi:hypothetical protein